MAAVDFGRGIEPGQILPRQATVHPLSRPLAQRENVGQGEAGSFAHDIAQLHPSVRAVGDDAILYVAAFPWDVPARSRSLT